MTKSTAAWTKSIKERYDGKLARVGRPKRMVDDRRKYQALDVEGKPLEREFIDGNDLHKLLFKLYSDFIPAPSGLVVPPGREITTKTRLVKGDRKVTLRYIPAIWWRKKGFKTKKAGLDFAKKMSDTGFDVTYEKLNRLQPTFFEETIGRFIRNNMGGFKVEKMSTPFKNFNSSFIIKHKYLPSISQDLRKYFQTFNTPLLTTIQRFRRETSPSIKVQIAVYARFFQYSFGGSFWAGAFAGDMTKNYTENTFMSAVYSITRDDQVQETLDLMMERIMEKVENFQGEGSGWILDRIRRTFVNMVKFQFTTGSSWIDLRADPFFKKNESIVNVKNVDDNCFQYSVIVGKHYRDMGNDIKKLTETRRIPGIFKKWLPKYPILSTLEMPFKFSTDNMEKVENEVQMKIHILQYTMGSKQVLPFYCSKAPYEEHMVLLLVIDNEAEMRHYVTVRSMSGLLGKHISRHHDARHFCFNCLGTNAHFSCRSALKNHQDLCLQNKTQHVKVPKEEDAILKFKNWGNLLEVPFTIYADLEALLFNIDQQKGEKTLRVKEHKACSMGYVIVSRMHGEPEIIREFQDRSPDAVRRFFDSIKKDTMELYEQHLSTRVKIVMTDELEKQFREATHCHICGEDGLLDEGATRYNEITGKTKKDPMARVRDHNHLTGEFTGAAHSCCNMKYQVKTMFPCFFHNMSGYDSNFLIREIEANECTKMDVLPLNRNRFSSFSMKFKLNENGGWEVPAAVSQEEEEEEQEGEERTDEAKYEGQDRRRRQGFELKFLDSVKFLNERLETLAEDLDPTDFKFTMQYIRDKCPWARTLPEKLELFKLIRRKGVYPYEYMDSWERFNETKLPPLRHFLSKLSKEVDSPSQLSDKDKAAMIKDVCHAYLVYKKFRCQDVGIYHDLYLSSDIRLLADIFERFRSISLDKFELDLAHYLSIPGLAWDGMLKLTKAQVELFKEGQLDMFTFCESDKIGGISGTGGKRFAKADNHYIRRDGTPKDDDSFILYMDENGLYSWAMSQKLPCGGYEWVTFDNWEKLLEDVDGDLGYMLEVDGYFPDETHDYLNDYPPMPENITVKESMLSEKAKQLWSKSAPRTATGEAQPYRGVQKLIPNLMPKEKHVVHFKALKLYRELGFVVTKVHRILEFHQRAWMEPFITHCMTERKKAKSEFEKAFWKLCCNANFGRCLMNKRKHKNFKVSSVQEQLQKWVNQLPVEGVLPQRINDKALHLVEIPKKTITLDQPIAVGVSILDLSKFMMYNWFYNVLKKKYEDKASLLYTDTDSFISKVITADFYKEMVNDPHFADTCDLSNYSNEHPAFEGMSAEQIQHLKRHKKVVGKMKDETHGVPIKEYVGLRAKMYSILTATSLCECAGVCGCNERDQKNTAKGVKQVITNRTEHSRYRDTLFQELTVSETMNFIRVDDQHNVYNEQITKTCFSCFDDKKSICTDGVSQLSYGHWRLKN